VARNTGNNDSPGWKWSNGEEIGPLVERVREAFPAVRPPEAFAQALKGQLLRAATGEKPAIAVEPLWGPRSVIWALVSFLLLGLVLYRWLKQYHKMQACQGVSNPS